MLLWRSGRFRGSTYSNMLCAKTQRGRNRHYGAVCAIPLRQHLDLPVTADVWLELHDRKTPNRLKLTVQILGGGSVLFLEGNRWGYPSPAEERLLRRLGLIGGKRECLWLEVWYREVT